MAPTKKREKDTTPVANSSNSNSNGTCTPPGANTTAAPVNMEKMNGHQQEQELFLQAFEKPTQIYRFLRNRHGTSPIFLNRTLSYMKDRMSRNNKKRTTFKVSTLLHTIFEKNEPSTNKYLNIVFNGLFKSANSSSHQWWNDGDVICVESTLFKITKSKRKDSTSDFQEILKHRSNIVFNPHENIGQYAGISIPLHAMNPLGDQHIIYKLLFRIKATSNSTTPGEDDENSEEGSAKRLKLIKKSYGCEINIFERNFNVIPEGDYEVAMREVGPSSSKSFSPKKRTWETLPHDNAALAAKFDSFKLYPTLKFRLAWSKQEIPAIITDEDMFKIGSIVNGNGGSSTDPMNSTKSGGDEEINHNNNCIKGSTSSTHTKREKIQIIYNFLYSNNTRQQTEYTQEVICPWCGLDCLRLYALLKHLKLCHARFNFTYQPAGNGARIDVTINDSYDGSYAGSPYDLAGPAGCSFARTCGPVRRTSVTNLLVCRPRRLKTGLDEFLVLDEDDLSNQRPYITGHNRLYHHTETCLPVHPKELGIDSEGESDPLWLRQKTIQMIDEFSDVNEGEKELMKLWNLHVMKHGYVGDCQLPLACEMFLDANGHEIIRKNLYRNFILHLSSLFDYGLISPETVYKTIQKLQVMLSKYREGQEMMSSQHAEQLKYWLEIGIHKQAELKLKLPQKHAISSIHNERKQQHDLVDVGNEAETEADAELEPDAEADSILAPETQNILPIPKRSNPAVKRAAGLQSSSNVGSGGSAVGDKLLKNSHHKSAGRKDSFLNDNEESTGIREKRAMVSKKEAGTESLCTERNLIRKTAKKSVDEQSISPNNKQDKQRCDNGSRRNSNPIVLENSTTSRSNDLTSKFRLSGKYSEKNRTTDLLQLKRKLSTKDMQQQQQPNMKRMRSINNISASTTRLALHSATSTTRSSTAHKLDASRRRSLPIRKSSGNVNVNINGNDNATKTPEKNSVKSGLRNRVSLPVAKSDKR